jgi:hypothetical protein
LLPATTPWAARRCDGAEVRFGAQVRNDNRDHTPPLVRLKAVCGPGDQGEPVVTVLLSDEDCSTCHPGGSAAELTTALKEHFEGIGGLALVSDLAVARELVRRARRLEALERAQGSKQGPHRAA